MFLFRFFVYLSFFTVFSFFPVKLSWVCCNTTTRIRWLKTPEIYFHTVLDLEVEIKGMAGPGSLWGSRGKSTPCLSPSFCCYRQALAFPGLKVPHQAACVFTWLFPLCLCLFSSSFKDTSYTGLGPTPFSITHLNLMTSAQTLFPRKVSFIGTRRLGLEHVFWKDAIQLITKYSLSLLNMCPNSIKKALPLSSAHTFLNFHRLNDSLRHNADRFVHVSILGAWSGWYIVRT